MIRMARRCASAFLLVVLFGVTVAPLALGVAKACAMCSRRCCCNPAEAGKACRLSRSCSAGEKDGAVPAGQFSRGALDRSTPRIGELIVAALLRGADLELKPGIDLPPPVPPPRPSHG